MLKPIIITKEAFRCDICSNETTFCLENHPCNTNKTLEVCDFKVGDEIQLHFPLFSRAGIYTGQLKSKPYGVVEMHYSRPAERIFPSWVSVFKELPIHTLVLDLSQSIFYSESEKKHEYRATKPGDGATSFSYLNITISDLLLWKEGNYSKLYEMKLLPKTPIFYRIKNWLISR